MPLKFLDIGCGLKPWIGGQNFFHQKPETRSRLTAKMIQFTSEPTLYCCLDRDIKALKKNRKMVRGEERQGRGFVQGKLKYVCADATHLPFPDKTFNAVILSDILSISPDEYCGCSRRCERSANPETARREKLPKCCNVLYPGVSDETKAVMIEEALRVTVMGGLFIVALYQTMEYATLSLELLERKKGEGILVLMDHVTRGQESMLDEEGVEFVFGKPQ